jgi:rhamnose utilization protein RhaD (predicted bifunctional aldolase and dehydrogenase)
MGIYLHLPAPGVPVIQTGVKMARLEDSAEFDVLRSFSARIGADPLLIQGAGGNTSIKDAATMWIKASGTQLKDADKGDIFVPVDWRGIAAAVDDDAALADQPHRFLLRDGLRPSIETCLHAILPDPVVIHVHCVNTIALAVRVDAEEQIANRLGEIDWRLVPYAKPGAGLAAAVKAKATDGTKVFVLRNHGLLIGADTVAEAAELMHLVIAKLAAEPATEPSQAASNAEAFADADYQPGPQGDLLNHLACDRDRLPLALGGGLYPDQVLFCGPRMVAKADGQSVNELVACLIAEGLSRPAVILVPDHGALIARDATPTERAMAQSVGQVMMRVPPDARLSYISDADCAELLDWDAEKYRLGLSLEG